MEEELSLRLFGLIGKPLTHSFSATYFQEKFEREKIEGCEYRNFPINSIEELKSLISVHPGLSGLNVTIPFKEDVIGQLDELDDVAKRVEAVNCISIKRGRLVGYNTDVYGFSLSIRPFLENKYERALILGTGGASKAVAFSLDQWAIPYHFVSRTPKGSREIGYDQLAVSTLKHFPLIINTTPLGTFPAVDVCPDIPYDGLTASHFMYDLIYNPDETLFLRRGREAGALTMNGLSMLRLQAERSWEIWNRPSQEYIDAH